MRCLLMYNKQFNSCKPPIEVMVEIVTNEFVKELDENDIYN